MIKHLRVTVDGVGYDVTVEVPEGAGVPAAPSTATPPVIPAATSAAMAAPTPPPSPAPTAAPAPATAGPVGPGDVPSPLTGRVTAVVVIAGQAVKEGDHLVTLEAMKMNTFVFAPKSGTVKDLKVAVGDAVEENQVLLRVE